MFLPRCTQEHERTLEPVGIQNTLALLTLIDEFIQKDEATRKFKSRNYEKNKLKEMDRKLLEARTKRIEKEKHDNAVSLSLRIQEIDKKKREQLDAVNRKFQKMEKESKERSMSLQKRVQIVKTEIHNEREKERRDSKDREQHLSDAETAKIQATKQMNKLKEEQRKEEIEVIKRRITEIDRHKTKARVKNEQTMQIMSLKQKQKFEDSVKRVRALECNYEREASSLTGRIHELEKEKAKQRCLLWKRNEQFKKELENREKISSLQRKNGEKWTQECITKLNRISNLGKRKDKMASELQENVLHLKEKQERENQNTIRRRQKIVNGRRNEEKMWKRIGQIARRKKRETNKVIDSIHDIRKKKDLHRIKESSSESDSLDERITGGYTSTKGETQSAKIEKEKKWDFEANEREKKRIKEAFGKLMSSFGDKSNSFS